MAEGRVTGQADDEAIAAQRYFQPGDIVFRLGSRPLGWLMNEPVTHGGIYVGGGLVRVSNSFDPTLGESVDRTTYRYRSFVDSRQFFEDVHLAV